MSTYLNNEFRDLLKRYGVDYDLSFAYRPIGKSLMEKTLLRRSAVMVSSNELRSRVLIIETDSLFEKVRTGQPAPNNPDTADIIVWPMQKRKERISDKPWYVGIEDRINPYKVDFFIKLTKIDNSNFATSYVSRMDRVSRAWEVSYQNPIDLIKNFAGLQ